MEETKEEKAYRAISKELNELQEQSHQARQSIKRLEQQEQDIFQINRQMQREIEFMQDYWGNDTPGRMFHQLQQDLRENANRIEAHIQRSCEELQQKEKHLQQQEETAMQERRKLTMQGGR